MTIQLQTLTTCLRMSNLAHSLANLGVAWVCRKPGMPDHQEVKRAQFRRRLHQAQIGIPLDHLRHAAGEREDEFRARKAAAPK
jgi:hypothetical protein